VIVCIKLIYQAILFFLYLRDNVLFLEKKIKKILKRKNHYYEKYIN